jgi:hypothetical protein
MDEVQTISRKAHELLELEVALHVEMRKPHLRGAAGGTFKR